MLIVRRGNGSRDRCEIRMATGRDEVGEMDSSGVQPGRGGKSVALAAERKLKNAESVIKGF